jgi:hypothetical protein
VAVVAVRKIPRRLTALVDQKYGCNDAGSFATLRPKIRIEEPTPPVSLTINISLRRKTFHSRFPQHVRSIY